MKPVHLFFLLLCVSCSVVDDFRRREFVYHELDKQQKIVIHVPKGYADEKYLLDTTGGKEQFYYYRNGALLYFTLNVTWHTENESLVEHLNPMASGRAVFINKGVDKDGLHWKEIRHDGFRFGYSYVPYATLDLFEQSINSLRLK